MRPELLIDYRQPNYNALIQARIERLQHIRANSTCVPILKQYYKTNPAQFIIDWGVTYDPMRMDEGGTGVIPFILFPAQIDWVEWVVDHWRNKKPGMTEKSRESGMSWLAIATSVTLCLFNDGISIGFGSRKESLVDVIGDMDSLLEKGRFFIEHLPREFTDGWNRNKDSRSLKISFKNGSFLKGEAGDNIGRGGRQSLYFVDEAAFIERSYLIEASLSQTTQCRIDISTPNGLANAFAEKRKSGKIDVFTFHWRQDPRKDEAWYQKQLDTLDPVTIAQEIDIDYAASAEGILIPGKWIQSAIDAHIKCGIEPSGIKTVGLDIADEGKDTNAFAGRYGVFLEHLFEWSGKGDDIYGTVVRAFDYCDSHGYARISYDSDGIGAGVRGDARVLNESRPGNTKISALPFRGSSKVIKPTAKVRGTSRTNEDYYANRKAQEWWHLRWLFQNTHRLVNGDTSVNPDNIISINSKLPLLNKLTSELSQPTYSLNNAGKILVDKKPDGVKSPNLADALMICFAQAEYDTISNEAAEAVRRMFN